VDNQYLSFKRHPLATIQEAAVSDPNDYEEIGIWCMPMARSNWRTKSKTWLTKWKRTDRFKNPGKRAITSSKMPKLGLNQQTNRAPSLARSG